MRLSAAGRFGWIRNTLVSSFSASASRLLLISVATCSKICTTSALCARTGMTKKHIRDRMHSRRSALCAFWWLLFGEFLFIELALAFFDRHDTVHADVRDFINCAAGPTHLNRINLRAFLETKVQPQITLRYVTVATPHLIRLRQITRDYSHACTDATAITLHTDCFDHDGIVCVPTVVAQQLRWSIEIRNQQINVTVVIDVSKRHAATRTVLRQYCSKLRRHFSKRRVAIVPVQQSRLAIAGQLRIDVPVRDKQVDPTVVIVIEKLRAPADVRQAQRRDLRCVRKIGKRVLAVVMVKRVVFVREDGDEDVELAVVIVVAGGHAHASLLAAILVDRSARAGSDFLGRAVAYVSVVEV